MAHGYHPRMEPFAPASVPTGLTLDSAGMLAADTICRRCGYNLRGLRPEGVCPECATAIALSLAGNRLRDAEPRWVAKLAAGVRWTFWGGLWTPILGVVFLLQVVTFSPLWGAIAVAAALARYRGAWLLTAREASPLDFSCGAGLQYCVRIGLAIEIAEEIWWALAATANPPRLEVSFFLILGIGPIVGEFAKLLVIERLARRIPSHRLAGWFRFMRWSYPGTVLAETALYIWFWVFILPGPMMPNFVPSVWWSIFEKGSLVLRLVLVVLAVIYLILLAKLGAKLRAQARAARLKWEAGAPEASSADT